MQLKRILKLFIISLIFLFLYLIIFSSDINAVYAGTLSADIDGIDESRYPVYKELINNLKVKHTNYNFQVYYTGIDWNSAIVSEYQSHGTCPKNLFNVGTNYQGMWYCPICGTRKYDNGSLCCASKDAIAYMMDPRNSIDENSIFQFKILDSSDVTIDDITRVVQNTFLNNSEAIQAIYDASVTYNINGYFLVAKILNEHGKNGSTLSRGERYNGSFAGCYNYFNIGSFGNSTAAIITNGLGYAANSGWTSIRASIIGGAQIVKENYMNTRKQNTVYFQKFNVVYEQGLYSYQYQQNIMAAETQGRSLKSYYNSDMNHTFIIPVFENMPKEKAPRPNPSVASTINYEEGTVTNVSSSLKVRSSPNGTAIGKLNNGESIKIIERATNQVAGIYWDLIVSNVDGTYGYAARIVGGDMCLTGNGNTNVSSGEVATIIEQVSSESNSNIIIKDGYLKITPSVSYEEITNSYSGAVIKDNSGNVINSGNIATGYKVAINDSEYVVIKKGDINSDGNVDIIDVVVLLNHIKGKNVLTDNSQIEAAKLKNNDDINISDIIVLLNSIKDKANITL